jgi:hypothetical protein
MNRRRFAVGTLASALVARGYDKNVYPETPNPTNNMIAGLQSSEMPSKEEIEELVNKTAEVVKGVQKSLQSAKRWLDSADPDLYKQDSDACNVAITTIAAIRANGRSAYALVALVSTLDDISLDCCRAEARMVVMIPTVKGDAKSTLTADLFSLTGAGKSAYDMSELLLHATLRYVSAEEEMLGYLLNKCGPK